MEPEHGREGADRQKMREKQSSVFTVGEMPAGL